MRTIFVADFDEWRRAARLQVLNGVTPGVVSFRFAGSAQRSLWAGDDAAAAVETTGGPPLPVPPKFVEFARFAACHSDDHTWNLMYRVLWRLTHGERRLLEDAA